jgi:histidinol-phosphatase
VSATATDAEAWLAFALACCDEADSIALASFRRRDLAISSKPDRTFVTEADQAIERTIRARLAEAHPEHGIVGEEYGSADGSGDVRWYIDPIDGTHNFMRGVPLFGTLLAVERAGEIVAGVMSAPALGERWWASLGGGAWARSAIGTGQARPIRVSAIGAIGDAQVVYGSAGDIAASGKAPGFVRLVADAWRDRGFGDFWGYALVAEGAAEAMIEADLHSWDLAPAMVIVEEAGGRLTSLDGRRTIHRGSALATNGILHDEVLERLRGA